jgi:sugar phosphate isomerase/epimerase
MKIRGSFGFTHTILLPLTLIAAAALCAAGCEKASSPQPAEPAKPTIVPMPKIGLCTSLNSADKVKAAGYDYVEEGVQKFLTPLEPDDKFAPNLEKSATAALPVYSYAGFLPGDLKCVGPDAVHDKILDYARTAFARAKAVGSSVIVFGSGAARRVPEGFGTEQAVAQFTELLKRMGPIAAEYGITVVIEPLNKNECNLVNSVKQGARIARAVNHPNICVLADIYHMALEDEGPESIIDAGPLLRHVHIAEKEGRARPGTAPYDFVPYFAALKKIGYSGGISFECRWKNFDEEIAPALTYVKQQLTTAWTQ